MAAVADRGEVDIKIGGQTRTLRFRTIELMALEEALGMDVLNYLAVNKGGTKFLVQAIFCGLVRQDKKVNPIRVAGWLDEYQGDRQELQKEILYAIARGKPGDEGKELVRVLDEAFNNTSHEDAEQERGPTPVG